MKTFTKSDSQAQGLFSRVDFSYREIMAIWHEVVDANDQETIVGFDRTDGVSPQNVAEVQRKLKEYGQSKGLRVVTRVQSDATGQPIAPDLARDTNTAVTIFATLAGAYTPRRRQRMGATFGTTDLTSALEKSVELATLDTILNGS
jgi:hypothetical protein